MTIVGPDLGHRRRLRDRGVRARRRAGRRGRRRCAGHEAMTIVPGDRGARHAGLRARCAAAASVARERAMTRQPRGGAPPSSTRSTRASFADSDGDGIGDLPGIAARLDHLAELGVDVLWLSPVYPSPQDDAGYDISDYQRHRPDVRHAGGLRRAARGRPRARDEADPRPRRQPHVRRAPVVRRVAREPRQPQARLVLVARGSRTTGARSSPARRGSSTPRRGEYYLHLFSRKQPDLNWENPEVRAAVYAMMNWWLDRGVDGFRMDVIDLISKARAARRRCAGARRRRLHFGCGPRNHEFLQEMHREVFAGRDAELLTVGEMPTVTLEEARLFTDPARRELDMVFQFEHVRLDRGATKWEHATAAR